MNNIGNCRTVYDLITLLQNIDDPIELDIVIQQCHVIFPGAIEQIYQALPWVQNKYILIVNKLSKVVKVSDIKLTKNDEIMCRWLNIRGVLSYVEFDRIYKLTDYTTKVNDRTAQTHILLLHHDFVNLINIGDYYKYVR